MDHHDIFDKNHNESIKKNCIFCKHFNLRYLFGLRNVFNNTSTEIPCPNYPEELSRHTDIMEVYYCAKFEHIGPKELKKIMALLEELKIVEKVSDSNNVEEEDASDPIMQFIDNEILHLSKDLKKLASMGVDLDQELKKICKMERSIGFALGFSLGLFIMFNIVILFLFLSRRFA